MIKKTFNVTAAADGTVTLNEKPYFNKLECGVTKIKFTLPDMEGFAYLLARHDRRAYYAIPIDSNGEIMMGTTVTQYHGRWAFNVCITTTEITADDRKDSAVYMSDTFEGLVYDNIADADQPATGEPNTIKLANDLSFILAQARSEQQAINQRYSSVETLARQVADNAADVSAAELRAKASEDAATLSAADAHDSMVSAEGSAEDAERFAQDANMHAEVANAASVSAREAADEANADLAAVEQLKDQAVQEAMEAARAAAGPAAEEAVAGVAAEVKEELDETVAQAKTDLETFVSESETQLQHYSDYSEQQANSASGSALAAMRSAQSAGQSVYNCSEQVGYARNAVAEAQEHAQAAYGSSATASNAAENANTSALAAAGSASDAAASATEIAGIYGPLGARVTTLEDNENNVILLSSADDLNDIVDITKKYTTANIDLPQHAPTNAYNLYIEVKYDSSANSARRRQIAYAVGVNARWERVKNYQGVWGSWVKFDSAYNRITRTVYTMASSSAPVSLPNTTHKGIGDGFTLPAGGMYIVTGMITFPANATGTRASSFANTKDTQGGMYRTRVRAADSGETQLNFTMITTTANGEATYYLNAYQNSGSTLSITNASVIVMKIL